MKFWIEILTWKSCKLEFSPPEQNSRTIPANSTRMVYFNFREHLTCYPHVANSLSIGGHKSGSSYSNGPKSRNPTHFHDYNNVKFSRDFSYNQLQELLPEVLANNYRLRYL